MNGQVVKIDGLEFPAGADEIVCNLWMFSLGRTKGDGTKVEPEDRFRYFKAAVDLAFNCEGSICRVLWTPWLELIVRELIGGWEDKRFLGVAGASSCVSGDTRMLDPKTGEQPTIQSLCEDKKRPWVMTLHGPVLADVPYLKGTAELFEFRLSDGNSFKCTGEHRLLTRSGWKFASQTTVGEELYGYAPCQPETTLGSVQRDPRQDAPHCSGTPEGSQLNYFSDFHQGGGLLQSARDSARGPLPRQDDVRKCSGYASERSDDLCSGLGRSRLYRAVVLSMRSAFLRRLLSGILLSRRSVSGTSSPLRSWFQRLSQFAKGCIQLHTFPEPLLSECHMRRMGCDVSLFSALESPSCSEYYRSSKQTFQPYQQPSACSQVPEKVGQSDHSSPCFCSMHSLGLMVPLIQVESITSVGTHDFYDLNVPVEHHYFAEGAIHHNSGKSHGVALYGLMEYWARPTETFFIVMSTTKDAARTRIWKSITQLWAQAQKKGCPGKLIDSNGYIKGLNQSMGTDRNSGVLLKPAGSASDGASDELLGIKNPNVIVAADEFNHLTDGILTTAYENMTSNERLMFVGMANPDRLTDPFGDLCEPKDGWKSVTENDERWATKYGACIRLNAEKCPRITHPEQFGHIKWMTDQAYCDRIAEKRGGKTSRGYYRFVKAFWCPDGATNSVYSEVEFLNAGALEEHEPIWDGPCYTLGSIDPAHSRNGDRSQALIGKLGKVDGRDHLHLCLYKTIEDDVLDKTASLTHQTVRGWKRLCEDWDVKPTRAIMDNTGAGTPFGHVVDAEWSSAVQKVNFQGKASERTIVFRNEDCSYFNKNSELWIQPKEFIRSGQITGVSKALLAELIEREFHKNEVRTVRVEGKDEAKKRLKRSPDIADTFNLLVEKAITLGHFKSEEVKKVAKMMDKGWSRFFGKKSLATVCGRKMR